MGATACELNVEKKVYAPSEMQWGTAGCLKHFRPRKYDEGENPLKDKRIFLILWRKQTNKKHKTWTGNGTLEVTAAKAILKDEIGKVLDVLTSLKPEKLEIDALLEFGLKDVEIQEELSTVEQCTAQRKEEIENWYRQQEESDGLLPSSASKCQRPMNMLKKPKLSPESKSLKESSSCSIQEVAPLCRLNEYICMLAPAELQYQTLHLLADHCQDLCTELPAESAHIVGIAEQICDHPVLLKHMLSDPLVSELLLPHLPPWQEMGLYDSAKFEFVHLLLDNLVVEHKEKCVIVANSQMCLDIIKGYCQCWQIAHIQLEDQIQAAIFNTPSMEAAKEPMVAVILTSVLPAVRLSCCKHVILYNYRGREEAMRLLATDGNAQMYTLITADCLEERQFQKELGLVDCTDSLNLHVNATHELLAARQNTLVTWNQWQPPFSEAFLKETFYCDELPNLSFVFSKQS
ncbi:GH18922 [Drosophila grimshawi]|uniref:GH18922 n=2 Tax=Drosophila grimshawi TaxID=7222 RepID=B4JH45_DROGR|nr:GH18922 [Drosophila grimshawi]